MDSDVNERPSICAVDVLHRKALGICFQAQNLFRNGSLVKIPVETIIVYKK